MAVLQTAHLVVAQIRSEPHWLLNDDDARRYGQAMANAARHFAFKTTQKAIDIGALALAVGMFEIPRIVRSAQLAKHPAPPQRGPAQVFRFTPNPAQKTPQAPSSPQPAASPATAAPAAVEPQDLASGPPDGSGFGGDAA